MTDIRVLTPGQAVEAATQLCINNGQVTAPRGMQVRELTNVTITVEEPWQVPIELTGRKLRHFIGAAEALQLVGQTSVPEHMVANVGAFASFADQGIFHGAYGIRVHGRLESLVRQLETDRDSRQAVLSIFDSRQDLGVERRDIPCTLTLQFFIRNERVCLRTSMRSNDVWLGLPYDLTQFIALQGAVAASLGRKLGWYSHTVGSLHLYEKDLPKAVGLRATRASHEDQRPLWLPSSIGDISARARRYLNDHVALAREGHFVPEFEMWLATTGGEQP